MKKTLILAVVVSVMGSGVPCRAAGSAGADPFNFLFLDAGARPVALGGAYTALATDADSLHYNPAGLGAVRRDQATFMHNQDFAGVTQEYLAYAAPQGWGANVTWLDFGDVARTTLSHPDGGLGSASSSDLAAEAGYGHAMGDWVSAGAGLKYVRQSLDGTVGQGFGVDLGLMGGLPAAPGLTLGVALQNLGPGVTFQGAHEDMPAALRAGAGYRLIVKGVAATLGADVRKERRDSPTLGAGAELVLARMLPLRVGFDLGNAAGPGVTAGVGFEMRDFRVDYAFVPMGDLGDAHRVSATLLWGGEGGHTPRWADIPAERGDFGWVFGQ